MLKTTSFVTINKDMQDELNRVAEKASRFTREDINATIIPEGREIRVALAVSDTRCEARHEDFFAALDSAEESFIRALRKKKEKTIDLKRRPAAQPDFGEEKED